MCRGCTVINIGEGFLPDFWGNKAIFWGIWVDWTYCSFYFFLCNKGMYP